MVVMMMMRLELELELELEHPMQAGQKPESIVLCTDGGLKHRRNARVYEPETAAVAAASTESLTMVASFAMSGSFLRQTTASRPADRERERQQKLSDAKQPAAGVVVNQS